MVDGLREEEHGRAWRLISAIRSSTHRTTHPKRTSKSGQTGQPGSSCPAVGRASLTSLCRSAGRAARPAQLALDFDITGERREQNSLINDIRREVERWRANNWNGVTPYTRKLLAHWAAQPPDRDEPVLFCQREAAETAIFLTEVAGRHGTADYRRRLEPENKLHNDGLPRVALKMATGTGKTVVMAMIIAWQTINKVMTPNDARFAKRFLVVTPGITIRDRLGVLHPERDDNYYRERDLVPADLWDALLQAQVEIINYHAFLPRDSKEIQGVAANTRKLLRGRQAGGGGRIPGDAGDGGRPDHALVRHRQGRDRGAQRRGAPLLPGQAARIRTARRTARIWTATVTPGSGSAACATCGAGQGSRWSTTCRPPRTT